MPSKTLSDLGHWLSRKHWDAKKSGIGEIRTCSRRILLGGELCEVIWKPADAEGRMLWINVPTSKYEEFGEAQTIQQAYEAVKEGEVSDA